ncbi:MAG: formyltransferase family protein [Myxococcota bacterium]
MEEAEVTQVVLLGKGDLAIRVGQWLRDAPGYALSWVVPVLPEPTWTGSLRAWAQAEGVPVVESGRWQDLPASFSPDLALSIFCHQIFPPRFITRCGRILNLHNSPLPRYRGMAPINWALKNGEREHGVTLHEITPSIDAGPIVAQLRYPIAPESDEVIDVYRRALEHGWALMADCLPRLQSLTSHPQDEAQATHYTARDLDALGDRRWFTRQEGGPRER